jgi:hypothetical protein
MVDEALESRSLSEDEGPWEVGVAADLGSFDRFCRFEAT